MVFRIKLILFALLTLTCHFANAQTHNDDFPDLSKSVYSDLDNGCRNNKNMKYLIAGTWGLMLEDEVQSKISLIKSCNKETAYKLLNALYETQPDLKREFANHFISITCTLNGRKVMTCILKKPQKGEDLTFLTFLNHKWLASVQ